MNTSKEHIYKNLELYEASVKEHNLPTWEELPDISLYMDQVIILMNKYLGIYYEHSGSEKFVTPSIINNYVKLKIIPAPVKKKYSKAHLAYLIMVCILKQCLSISTVQSIVPLSASEDELKEIYEIFRKNEKLITESNISQMKNIINEKNSDKENSSVLFRELAITAALSANIFKIFTDIFTQSTDSKETSAKKTV